MEKLKILTYNIHKGKTQVRGKPIMNAIRKEVLNVEADIVFLQELCGVDPDDNYLSPIERLAENDYPHHVYGKNAVYKNNHHGNAILSKYPIKFSENIEISQTRFASRGLLHVVIEHNEFKEGLHLLCIHLDLTEKARQKQYKDIVARIHHHIPDHCPFVLAGDFNDWRGNFNESLIAEMHISPCLDKKNKAPLTYPSRLPALPLDRIYARHLQLENLNVLSGKPWNTLSDHLPLVAEFSF